MTTRRAQAQRSGSRYVTPHAASDRARKHRIPVPTPDDPGATLEALIECRVRLIAELERCANIPGAHAIVELENALAETDEIIALIREALPAH